MDSAAQPAARTMAFDFKAAVVASLLLLAVSLAFPPRAYEEGDFDLQSGTHTVIGESVHLTPFWTSEEPWRLKVSEKLMLPASRLRVYRPIGISFGFWLAWEVPGILVIATLVGWAKRRKVMESSAE